MITDLDRKALGHLTVLGPGIWRVAPGCFQPNDLCRQQEERGLIELAHVDGRWRMKLTAFGRIAFGLKG